MSGDSRSHLDRSTQSRFRLILLTVVAVLALVLTPLMLSGELRLELAHRFNLVPGRDIEQIAGPDDNASLIVVPIHVTATSGRPEPRFHAAYIATESSSDVELVSIDDGTRIALPLESLDFWSNSHDGSHVLFQDTRDPDNVRGALVNVTTHEVTTMPPESPYPNDIPGDWEMASWETSMGSCHGVSPNARYISCFQNSRLPSFFAGDWELRVLVYGDSDMTATIYRGRGVAPWVGWSDDDSRLYFQSEHGIWVAPVSLEMFSYRDSNNV